MPHYVRNIGGVSFHFFFFFFFFFFVCLGRQKHENKVNAKYKCCTIFKQVKIIQCILF